MSKQRYDSVWDAIEDTPQQAASMKARAELMRAVQAHIKRKELTQSKAAKLFDVTQPRISDLMRGRIDLFSIETLMDMLSRAGVQVKFTLRKRAA